MTVSTFLVPLLVILLFVIAIILWRTARFPMSVDSEIVLSDAPSPDADGELVAAHLSQAVQLATISTQGAPLPSTLKAILSLHALLERLYPRVHSTLKKEIINGYSLLYTWEGTQPDLPPALFLAHLDVVPAEDAPQAPTDIEESLRTAIAEGRPGAPWKYPPFSGQIADGYVWGRGATDDKCNVIGQMEAVEALLRSRYRPARTVMLAFGQDEEVGGRDGAATIAALLEKRGVRLFSVIDEGGEVTEGILPGVKAPVAMVGITEKGFLSLMLSVESQGGHSSAPPAHTAIGVLASAVQRLEAHPFTPHLESALPMLRYLGADLPVWLQLPLANLWLTGGLVRRTLAASPLTNAIIRTTQAVTIFHGGVKDNILPPKADAVVNFRILPGETHRSVYEHTTHAVADPRVSIRPARGETLSDSGWEPTPTSSLKSTAFRRLAGLIQAHFPTAAISPYGVVGATDARYYAPLSDSVYRFAPISGGKDELNRAHGTNERLSLANCGKMVAFYTDAIKALSLE